MANKKNIPWVYQRKSDKFRKESDRLDHVLRGVNNRLKKADFEKKENQQGQD